MECPICLIDWDANTVVPYMLTCGHSFCKECLVLMLPEQKTVLLCPTCSKEIEVSNQKDLLSQLSKNFAVLSMIEQKQ